MEEEGANENESNYVNFYQRHLRQFKEHITGIDRDVGSLFPSYIPPCGYWTSEEKNLFFHALSVHSKLRPDLIADEIPSKTIVDVMVYLDMIESAAAEQPRKRARANVEAATEVSDKWIAFEEKAAKVVIDREVEWEKEHRDEQRRSVLKAREHDQRAALSKEEKGRHRRRQVAKEVAMDLSEQWTKADYMRSLSGPHLQAIDHILREAEEPSEVREVPGQEEAMKEDEDARPDAEEINVVPDTFIDPALLAISRPLTPPSGSPYPDSWIRGDQQSMGGTSKTLVADVPTLPDETADQEDVEDVPPRDELGLTGEALAALSPLSRRRHQKRLYMRRKRAQASGGVVSASVARLKPGRKTNKRLEKQAAKAKEQEEKARQRELEDANIHDIAEAGENGSNVDLEGAEYVIPAEEGKEEHFDVTAGKEEYEVTLPKGSEDEEESKDLRHRNIGGTTLPYKIMQDLGDLGYNADTLQAEGLGLFHLTNLHKLMGIYASLQSVPEFVGTSVSASTIQLLHAHVIHFLHKLVDTSITLRERERRSKGHTKIWRMRHHLISTPTIHKALQMMGAPLDKKVHFATLIDRVACLNETLVRTSKRREDEEKVRAEERAGAKRNVHVGSEDEEDEESDSSGSETESYSDEDEESTSLRPLPLLPTHRSINPPFVYLRTLDHAHPHLRPRVPFGRSGSTPTFADDNEWEGDGELIPEEIDADALLQEMLEEEEVDTRDREVDISEESALWERMRRVEQFGEGEELLEKREVRKRESDEGGDESRERKRRKTKNSLRYAEPDSAHFAGIKSAVYVEDSD